MNDNKKTISLAFESLMKSQSLQKIVAGALGPESPTNFDCDRIVLSKDENGDEFVEYRFSNGMASRAIENKERGTYRSIRNPEMARRD